MQAFVEANRHLKRAFISGEDDDVASGVQNCGADLAVIEVLLNVQPNVRRQSRIQIVADVTPNVFALYNHGSHLLFGLGLTLFKSGPSCFCNIMCAR
jgi:hypothetical protein